MPDKVLVVDDEHDILSLARMVLEKRGYQVITASRGEEAIEKAESEMPDLILLDMVLPGKSGLEACRFLKSQPKTQHIPAVVFTVLARDVDRKMATEAGCDGYFNKPFTPDGLASEVREHIEKARSSKFSRQIGVEHTQLRGKKILLEFDPSTRHERLVRDFALECASHKETVIVLTKQASVIRQVLQGDQNVQLLDAKPDLMLSPILEKHANEPLSLIYDSLTDLALSTDPQTSYGFARNAIELIATPRITALFLFNPSAHESRDVSSLRGLFSSRVSYGKQGIESFRVT